MGQTGATASMTSAVDAGTAESGASGGTLVTVDGRTLPLRDVRLRCDARGGLARVVLEQRLPLACCRSQTAPISAVRCAIRRASAT